MSKKGIIVTDHDELQLIMNWRTRTDDYRACVAAISNGIDTSKYPLQEVRKAAGEIISFTGGKERRREHEKQ